MGEDSGRTNDGAPEARSAALERARRAASELISILGPGIEAGDASATETASSAARSRAAARLESALREAHRVGVSTDELATECRLAHEMVQVTVRGGALFDEG